ncbi:hypothetical protein ON010_g1061 [Phytophthora cinnamomi]|nr:hypothetical protein ON010_g1061 [Phytophthora cinnamomi]
MHPWGRGASQPRADRWPTVPDSVDHRGTAGSSGAVRRNDVNGARCDVVYYQGRRGHSAETQGTGEAFWTSTAPSLVYQRQVSTARSHQLCPSDHDITPENAPLRQNIPPVVETRTLGDQQDEDQEENREKQSPSSSSTDQKKPRKRPHYLSHEVRCQIIERIAGGEQQAALAREFGVTRAAVCHIQKHRFEILSRPVAQQTTSARPTARPRSADILHVPATDNAA